MFRNFLFLFILLRYNISFAQNIPETIQLKFIDEHQKPVFGVYVIYTSQAILLSTSDIDGECRIKTSLFRPTDTLQFQGLGYITCKMSVKDIITRPHIRLKELKYQLSEANAWGISTERILNIASSKLKKAKVSRTPLCRYFGPSQYEKITKCKDIVVEYRREYGYYFTSGDIIPYNIYDKTFRSYLLPQFMARSYNLTINGKDTLVPIYLTSDNIRFDFGTRKIFTLNRAIQLFGPLFNGRKYYEIHPIESEGADYVFTFKTRPEAYPQNIRISCKGTFTIDREHLQLKSMDFDYIDYQLLRQVLLSNQRKTESPFSTHASLTFTYDSCGQNYIRSCHQVTTWKYDLDNNFVLIEQPSRDLPGFHQLVEEEAFYCYNYQKIRPELQNDKILSKIHLTQRYPTGTYSPEVFQQLPYLLDIQKGRKDLERYMKLEDQFRINSDKPYYPENYISRSDIDDKERTIYKTNLIATRKYLFEVFGNDKDQ